MKTVEKVIFQWNNVGVELNEGASQEDIEQFEIELDFRFEDDFKTYLFIANGFKDYASDDDLFSFWSLDRIKTELLHPHPDQLICFADYCICLSNFGFNREDGKIYSFFEHHTKLYLVAENFQDLLETYIKNSDDLIR